MATPVTLEAASKKEYDFVIVGGGTAGAVVAARLSENPKFSVLLVEAGKKETPIEDTIVPLLGPKALTHPELTWQFELEPQVGLNNRPIPYPRGKAIGGTSWINLMFALRGPTSDWDRIAQITGDKGWSWEAMLPYAKKLETFVPPTGKWDWEPVYDASTNGTSGPIRISVPNSLNLAVADVLEAARTQYKDVAPLNKNVNDGHMLGVGLLPGTIGGGIRNSSANYLSGEPRANLDLLTEATVTKVLFSSGSPPKATGIQYTTGPGQPSFEVKAKNEIILAAGAINSPYILLHSGIGPAAELKSFGIPIVKDSPEVGKNLQDHHLLFGGHYIVDRRDTIDTLLQDQSAGQAAQQEFGTSFSGPLANTVAPSVGFWRLPADAPILFKPGVVDTSSGPEAPHYEVLFGDGYINIFPPPATVNYFTTTTVGLTPSSKGEVKLKSGDIWTAPSINPNLLGNELDLHIAVEAVKKGREYMKADIFKSYLREEYGPIAEAKTDEQIAEFVKTYAISCWHPTSTAALSAKDSSQGVLNPDLTVKGVEGLRVADASVFPHIPAAHPQLPIYMIAERASDIIAAKYA